jgi:hypothetical protein
MKGWAEYPFREFWVDPRIGGFDPQNLVVEVKRKGGNHGQRTKETHEWFW